MQDKKNVPRCACGLCDELPHFRRGKYSKYALGHKSHKKREELYRKKYGDPVCAACNSLVSFYRGKPNKYCSQKCNGKNTGFSLQKTQEKIRENVKEKYGVENVSHLDDVRHKISSAKLGKSGHKHTPEDRKRISKMFRKFWKKDWFRKKVTKAISDGIMKNPAERKRRSEWLKEKIKDPEFRKKMFGKHPGRLSRLHRRLRNELGLDKLGFTSEQLVGRYHVDELCLDKKVIVEVNGDYTHANPKKYDAEFIVRLRGQAYTAQEKWDNDAARQKKLEKLGYCVIVVWESDDLIEKKHEIELALQGE